MTIADAQADLRRAYVGGGPGIFVSALIWFAAAVVERRSGVAPAFTLLFFGGMLIFPSATILSRHAFRRAPAASDNPLGLAALESTVAMIGGLLAAWLFLRFEPAWVFPLAAIAVGTHYCVFRTIYGDRLFWLLGALLTGVGLLDIFNTMTIPGGTIVAVAIIEFVFAVTFTMRAPRQAAAR